MLLLLILMTNAVPLPSTMTSCTTRRREGMVALMMKPAAVDVGDDRMKNVTKMHWGKRCKVKE